MRLEGMRDMREKNNECSADEKLFDFILEKISEGILIVDFQGRIIYANSAALSFCDVSEKSLIGSDFTQMFSIDDRPTVIELMKTAKDKLEARAEKYPMRLNEHIVNARFLSSSKKDDNSIVIINDVTAQHRAKKALKLPCR